MSEHQIPSGHRFYSIVFAAVLILSLTITISTDDIPTDEETWNECCHHDDCVQGKVDIVDAQGDLFWIKFKSFQEFFVEKEKVLPSSNGKEYVCWLKHVTDDDGDVIGSPNNENVLCVFKLYHMVSK